MGGYDDNMSLERDKRSREPGPADLYYIGIIIIITIYKPIIIGRSDNDTVIVGPLVAWPHILISDLFSRYSTQTYLYVRLIL